MKEKQKLSLLFCYYAAVTNRNKNIRIALFQSKVNTPPPSASRPQRIGTDNQKYTNT